MNTHTITTSGIDCHCPPDAPKRCAPTDHKRDTSGRPLCCPYDNAAMAAYYGVSKPEWVATAGRRAAMRKRLRGDIEDIAQRAADTRRGM